MARSPHRQVPHSKIGLDELTEQMLKRVRLSELLLNVYRRLIIHAQQ